MADETEFRPGDSDNNLLRKILQRLKLLIFAVTEIPPPAVSVSINPEDIEIGAIEIKNSNTDDRAQVENSAPGANDFGLVTRNIPSGTQPVSGSVAVTNLPATQPVSGTVNVGNFPATQPVSGTVAVNNFPAVQPVSSTQLPAALVGGRLDNNIGAWMGSAAPTVGQKAMAAGLPVVVASDQMSFPVIDDVHFLARHYGSIGTMAAKAYHIFGRRAAFHSTSTLQDIGEFLSNTTDLLPELTGVESLEVVSSSANDAAAGTGTRTIQIVYMDLGGNMVTSAPITMNGVTPVAIAWKALFIYRMEALTGGSLETSAGNITLQIAGGGAVQEQISAGGNRSMTCRFMSPTGWHAHIRRWEIGTAGNFVADARLRITATTDGILSTRYIFKDNIFVGTQGNAYQEIPWLTIPSMAKAKISLLTSATAAANRIDASFSVLMIQN